MMSTKPKLPIITAGAALFALSSATTASAISLYSITDLGQFYPFALNDSGELLGNTLFATNPSPVFLYENGTLTDLTSIGATDINNLGQVIGISGGQLFVRENDGTLQNLGEASCSPAPCPYITTALNRYPEINDLGQVVAASQSSDAPYNPLSRHVTLRNTDGTQIPVTDTQFNVSINDLAINNLGQVVYSLGYRLTLSQIEFWNQGTTTPIFFDAFTANPQQGYPVGINDLSQVVYSYSEFIPAGVRTRTFLWDNSISTDLGNLGSQYAVAGAINNSSQVVGASDTSSGATHAFLWENGTMFDLNNYIAADSGWVLSNASQINNQGQIAGFGNFNGEQRGFLLTPEAEPIPEPTYTLEVLGLGAIALGFRWLRNRRAAAGITPRHITRMWIAAPDCLTHLCKSLSDQPRQVKQRIRENQIRS